MDEKEKKILNLVLHYLPYYGDFKLMDKITLIKSNKILEVYNTLTNPQEQVLTISEYLVSHGFAITRNDLDVDGTSIEFTARGRWLKESGTFEVYQKSQKDKKDKKIKQELEVEAAQQRNVQMNRLTLIIAISTGIAAIYYILEIMNHIFGIYFN